MPKAQNITVLSLKRAAQRHVFNIQCSNNTRTSRFLVKRQAHRSVISIRDQEENRDATVPANCSNVVFCYEALNGYRQMLELYASAAKEVDHQASDQSPECREPGFYSVVRR